MRPAAGAEEVYGLGELSSSEKAGLEALLPQLKAEIEKGVRFVKDAP